MAGSLARVGSGIRALREGRKLSQRELAELVGINSGGLSRIERGATNPSLDSLGRLLDALDASLLDLHRAITDESPSPSAAVPTAAPLDERASIQRYAVLALERLARGEPPPSHIGAGPEGGRVNGGTAPARRERDVDIRDRKDDSRDR